MTRAPHTPPSNPSASANERFKTRFNSLFWSSMMLATLAHFGVFAYFPEMTTEDVSYTSEEFMAVELPPEIQIPPPPAQIARPATPVIATTDLDEDITIAPTTFDLNPVQDLPLPPPPQEGVEEVVDGPRFTPFTVAPSVLNRAEVARALADNYPPLLRASGIGGTVRVYFFISEEGLVEDSRIEESSGHAPLDDAALKVAELYRFSPALNRDKKVPVWVVFPVEFSVR